MNFRNRWLHTLLGFFSQRDPLQYVDGTSLYRAYFVPMGVDPFGLAIRVCFRQFFSSGPGDHSDMDYATMFDRPVFLLRPRMAHVFIQIEFDDGTVTSYSYHPDEWPIPATFGNGFSTQDMNRQRPARVSINDPGDRNCGDDDYLGRHRCFEVPCEEGSEERLRDYIQAWIEANGAGIEEGDWDQSNPRYPGNWIGTIRHIDPSPNCTAHYWLYGQNCGWWATTMVNDVGLTISPGNLHTMTLWNNGAGITFVGPYSGFYPPRGGRRWCYGRTDIRPPMRGE